MTRWIHLSLHHSTQAMLNRYLARLPCQRAEWSEFGYKCTDRQVAEMEEPPIELCISCEARRKRRQI